MIRKALHIIMAAVVLVSTMTVTINLHYCHDQLIDLALYSPAESCCDSDKAASCHTEEGVKQMHHCEDDSLVLEGREDLMGSSFTFSLANNHSIDLLFGTDSHHVYNVYAESFKPAVPEYYFPPPYQEVDLSQIQSYLI